MSLLLSQESSGPQTLTANATRLIASAVAAVLVAGGVALPAGAPTLRVTPPAASLSSQVSIQASAPVVRLTAGAAVQPGGVTRSATSPTIVIGARPASLVLILQAGSPITTLTAAPATLIPGAVNLAASTPRIVFTAAPALIPIPSITVDAGTPALTIAAGSATLQSDLPVPPSVGSRGWIGPFRSRRPIERPSAVTVRASTPRIVATAGQATALVGPAPTLMMVSAQRLRTQNPGASAFAGPNLEDEDMFVLAGVLKPWRS